MAKIVIALVFTLIVSASIPSPVFAAETPRSKPAPVALGGLSLSVDTGWYIFNGSEERDSTPLYGLKVGYDKVGTSIADSLGLEGTVNYFTTKSKAGAGDSSGYLFRLDALYPFVVRERWMPFLAVGGGGIFIDTGSRSESNYLFNYGAGLKYFMEDYLAVRFDARHLIVYNDVTTRSNFEFGIGLSYYFGKERKKKAVPPPVKPVSAIPALEEIDNSAGKRVVGERIPAAKYDKADVPPSSSLAPLYALTPLLALESSARIPFQAEAPQESVGVKYMASITSPAKVEAAPAPAGAIPPMQVAVSAVAPGKTPPSAATIPSPVITEERKREPAVEKSVVRKLSVEFNSDSSYITPEFHKELVGLADIMKSSDSISARIEGYPDSTGDIIHNIVLSEKRVERVQNSLINLGANSDRISTVVYEPSQPIADSAVGEGRLKDQQAVTLVTLTGAAKTAPAPAAAEAIPVPAKIETAPPQPEPTPAPLEEKKPLQGTAPGVAPAPLAPLAPPTVVETVPSARAETVTAPVAAPAPSAIVEAVPSVRGAAVPAPVTAEEIPAPAKVEKAPLKTETAPIPVEEKKSLPVTAPGAVAAPLAPPTVVETVPSVRAETVPAPVAAEEIPAPAKIETAPLQPEPTPAPVEEKKLVQGTAPGVTLAPPAIVEAVPAPVAAEEIPAPAKVETAPLKTETAPIPVEEKKPLQVTAPAIVPAPPARVETAPSVRGEAVPAPAAAEVITAPEKVETAPLPPPTRVETMPSGRAEAVPAPVAAGEIPAPAKVETAPLKAEPTPIPAEEKKPLPGTAPGAVAAPLAPPTRGEAVPAPVAAEEIPAPAKVETAPLKTETAPIPAEEKKPLQVTTPGVAPAPLVPLASPTRLEAVPAPVTAEGITAPEKVETAPLKPEPTTIPVEEKKPLQGTEPGAVLAPLAPPTRGEAVPVPATAEGITAPEKVETAPLKAEPTPIPAEEKKPLQGTAPGVVAAPLAPPTRAEAVPAPVTAEEIPAPAKIKTAPLKPEPTPIPVEVKKTLQGTAPGVAPAPLAPPTVVETAPAPVAPEEIPVPAKVETAPVNTETAPRPVETENPAHQAVGKKVVRKLTVEFDTDSSYIKRKYYNELRKIADIIKSSANASARIEGHTDITGRFSYNIKLSKKRAQSVRSSLIKLGGDPDRITTAGYGPTRPVADNDTVEGRRRNRRAVTFVTLIIYE